jgi:hypothetical protein
MEWRDGQWAIEEQQANNNLNDLANAADNVEGNANGLDLQSSLTVTVSLSDGEQSNKLPIPQVNALHEEVNQQATDQQEDEMQFIQQDAIIPINVQRDAQALNMENFM